MRPRAGPVVRAALRAGLLGAGAVGGYLLLNLFASPAHADPADGLDIGGLVGDLPLVEPADVPALEASDAPEASESVDAPEPAEPTDTPEITGVTQAVTGTAAGITDAVTDVATDAATDVLAGTVAAPLLEVAGESVDQLVAGVDTTAESTVEPITSTVDAVLPELAAPVPDDIADPPLAPVPLAPPAPQPVAVAPQEVATAPAGATVSAPARGSPLPLPAGFSPVTHVPDSQAGQAVAAPATQTGHDPPPTRPPAPPTVRTTQQLAGDSFDPGHPLPWTGPATAAAYEPDPDSRRSLVDIAYRSLVMPVSAPPG